MYIIHIIHQLLDPYTTLKSYNIPLEKTFKKDNASAKPSKTSVCDKGNKRVILRGAGRACLSIWPDVEINNITSTARAQKKNKNSRLETQNEF